MSRLWGWIVSKREVEDAAQISSLEKGVVRGLGLQEQEQASWASEWGKGGGDAFSAG